MIRSKMLCAVASMTALLLTNGVMLAQPDTAPPEQVFDLIIRNGQVVDGTGNPWLYADVAIDDDRIVRIGNLSEARGKREIDATGRIVAPGFIDVHTHADDKLYRLPHAENFIRDGVTTIVTGNCGRSVSDFDEYFRRLETEGVALNVASLVGHNTVLRTVKGDHGEPMTPEQFEQAKQMLARAMRDGAIGMSTGLIYTPGTYSDTEEIIELQKVVAPFGGIYATHMRSENTRIIEAIEEALRIGREAGSRVQVSHFKLPRDVSETIGGSDTTLGLIAAARADGQEVWLDQYPYTASSTNIGVMLPDWVLEGGREQAEQILRDPEQIDRVLADMAENHERTRRRSDLSYAVIANCEAHLEFNGKDMVRVTQVQKLRRQRGEDVDLDAIAPGAWPAVTMPEQYLAVIDIVLKGGASCVYHTMAESDVANIMRHPLVSICSDSGVREFGVGRPHPRGYGANARVLGRYVREKNVVPLEEAIRKMTAMPAAAFRIDGRGLLREGAYADLTIFDPDTVIDRATFDSPHQYPAGIDYVIVNGRPVIDAGELTDALPGRPVYGPGYVDGH